MKDGDFDVEGDKMDKRDKDPMDDEAHSVIKENEVDHG